ncbi:thioredoxin-disulfide reductase [Desulforegula conservatrix]|uniref:thioredoxin-disulfide reductase n=1 Tax=Desulforegula conservatrix TaxID=153026 RepID=UPI0003FC58F3|nr:thioredoxin-disulfide reductase [Desulforegula conservatrix]
MDKLKYDLVIIGGGPAGLTAGIYASRSRLDTLLIEKITPGGQALVTDWIENYPGFPGGISGPDLVMNMVDQAKKFDLKIESAEVQSVDFSGPLKKIFLDGDRILETKAVIIASGASPRKLGVPGEDRFYGKGISFCGTCDGPFFRNKDVIAIGGGDTAVQESIFLTKFVNKVYLVHRRDKLRAAKILQERAFANDKIDFIWDSVVTSFNGGLMSLEGATVKNLKTGESSEVKIDGAFIWIGILPNTSFIGNAVDIDEYGFIRVNDKMETSVPGVFAAGDVRDTPLRQIATAVGDSAIAAMSAEHYIENFEHE